MYNDPKTVKSIVIATAFSFVTLVLMMLSICFLAIWQGPDAQTDNIFDTAVPLFVTAVSQFIFGMLTAKITKHTASILLGTACVIPLLVVLTAAALFLLAETAGGSDAAGWLMFIILLATIPLFSSIPTMLLFGFLGSVIYSLGHQKSMTPLFRKSSKNVDQFYYDRFGQPMQPMRPMPPTQPMPPYQNQVNPNWNNTQNGDLERRK